MRVELTTSQLGALEEALEHYGMGWVCQEWLADCPLLPGHATTRSIVMPAVGWLKAVHLLAEFTVGPYGGNRKGAKGAAINGRSRIASALHHYVMHPAFFGVGLLGQHPEIFPCWSLPNAEKPGRLYDPLPVPNGEFIHLFPYPDGEFTLWSPQRVLSVGDSGSVLDEECHLRFVQGSERGAPASPAPS